MTPMPFLLCVQSRSSDMVHDICLIVKCDSGVGLPSLAYGHGFGNSLGSVDVKGLIDME